MGKVLKLFIKIIFLGWICKIFLGFIGIQAELTKLNDIGEWWKIGIFVGLVLVLLAVSSKKKLLIRTKQKNHTQKKSTKKDCEKINEENYIEDNPTEIYENLVILSKVIIILIICFPFFFTVYVFTGWVFSLPLINNLINLSI